LVRDMRPNGVNGPKSAEGRVILSKFALLAVAMLAAVVAAFKPAEILALVSASFSLAASAFFPGMVLGMAWQRVHRPAVVLGMLSGLGVTIFYMVVNAPGFRHFWELDPYGGLWWGIQPLSAGVFGVPVGFLVMVLATWLIPQRLIGQNPPSRTPRSDLSTSYPGL
jgi:cation/acetate symporter